MPDSVTIEALSTAGLETTGAMSEAFAVPMTLSTGQLTTVLTRPLYVVGWVRGMANAPVVSTDLDIEEAFSEWSEESLAIADEQFAAGSASWPSY